MVTNRALQLKKLTESSKKIWRFFWKDDSVWSWLVNIVVAFLVIRYLIYPLLGVLLGTSLPIVAVISESMDHGLYDGKLCGQQFSEFKDSFNHYWEICGTWYEDRGISKEQFQQFPFKDGFYKGDVIILWRANKDNLKVGDILVFQGDKPQPIIHRVVKVWEEKEKYFYQTKGDHNGDSISGFLGETKINEKRLLGKGIIKVPYLGWLKILFVDAVKPLGVNIQR